MKMLLILAAWLFVPCTMLAEAPSPPPIGDKPSVIESPGTPKSLAAEPAVLGKTATGWRVTYKGRQFEFTGDSKAAAESVQAAIVAMIDGTTPKAMESQFPVFRKSGNSPQSTCGWVLINGQWQYRCPNAR